MLQTNHTTTYIIVKHHFKFDGTHRSNLDKLSFSEDQLFEKIASKPFPPKYVTAEDQKEVLLNEQ